MQERLVRVAYQRGEERGEDVILALEEGTGVHRLTEDIVDNDEVRIDALNYGNDVVDDRLLSV